MQQKENLSSGKPRVLDINQVFPIDQCFEEKKFEPLNFEEPEPPMHLKRTEFLLSLRRAAPFLLTAEIRIKYLAHRVAATFTGSEL